MILFQLPLAPEFGSAVNMDRRSLPTTSPMHAVAGLPLLYYKLCFPLLHNTVGDFVMSGAGDIELNPGPLDGKSMKIMKMRPT